MDAAGRKRVEAVVETLANLRNDGETLAEIAHDTRNMVTALGLYCDLLEEPGVLTSPFLHYANELRLVATASRRLVEKLMALDLRLGSGTELSASASSDAARAATVPQGADRHRWELMPVGPIDNLAAELLASRNLLAALAGPSIALTMDAEGGALPVRLNGEDLTRILVNLVKNAAEAMPKGGRIRLGLRELPAKPSGFVLALTVEDNGPGIPQKALEKIFDSGYTTHTGNASLLGASTSGSSKQAGCGAAHRGLGLAITRSIVEAAGGRIHVANRIPTGARFEIELPLRSR